MTRCTLPKIDTNFGLIHWTDAERNKEYHLLPEALAERIIDHLKANVEWVIKTPGNNIDIENCRNEARAILEEMTATSSGVAPERSPK